LYVGNYEYSGEFGYCEIRLAGHLENNNATQPVKWSNPILETGLDLGHGQNRIDVSLSSLNRSALGRGIALQVSFNDTLATQVANTSCPGGRGRAFGPCEADRGVVVQERVGRTHVVAAGFDVLVVSQDGERRLRTVVEPW
jgi:hypothetical protein